VYAVGEEDGFVAALGGGGAAAAGGGAGSAAAQATPATGAGAGETDRPRCLICLGELGSQSRGASACIQACAHRFCRSCLSTWVAGGVRKTCPA
jgi:hypothetical protein